MEMTASEPAAGGPRSRLVRVLRSSLLLAFAGLLIISAILATYAWPYLLTQYHVRRIFEQSDRYHAPLRWSDSPSSTWGGRLKHLHFRLRAGIDRLDVRAEELISASPHRLAHLAGIPGLETVALSEGRFGADDFRQLARIPDLKVLMIYSRRCEVDLEAFRELSGHKHLEEIQIEDVDVEGERLVLIDLQQLRALSVRNVRMSDVELARLPQLSTVSIGRCPFADSGIRNLRPISKSLRRLELPLTQITSASISHLLALDHLDTLDLRRLQQSDGRADGLTRADYEQLDQHPTLRRIVLRPYSSQPLPPEAAGLRRVQAI